MALMSPAQDFLGGGSPTPLFAPAIKGGNRCPAPSSLFFFSGHEIGDRLTVAGDRDALAGLGDAQKFGETRLGVGGGDLHVADCPSDRTRPVVCGFDGVTSRLDMPEPINGRAGAAKCMVLVDYLGGLAREENPGLSFNYNTGETNLVGAVLRAAIGNNASSYLEAKVWRPFMEHPATWSITENVELGGCCIHATLRDYARIGMFALSDGVLPDGTRVLPEGWMRDSTTPSAGYPGYGYLWWLREDGAYAGIGIFGQLIWVHPKDQMVIVTHSAWPAATGSSAHRWALVDALHAHVAEAD